MRTLLFCLFLLGAVAAEEPIWLKEEIKDPAQITPAERKDRALSCLEVLERWEKGDFARSSVGPLLMLRAELRGDLAERAARALKGVTGEDFGTDFAKWQAWFDGVKATEKWAPTKIYKLVRNPKFIMEGPEILQAWSAEPAMEIEKGVRLLKGPCAMRCSRLSLYVSSETDLEVRWDEDKREIGLKSTEPFAISGYSGTRDGFYLTREVTLRPYHLVGIEYMNMDDLRKVPQEVVEAKIDDPDAAVVMSYVFEQAQGGNLLPLVRVLCSKTLRKMEDPKRRTKFIEEIGLSEEEGAKLSAEQLMVALLRKDYAETFLFLTVSVSPNDEGEGVRYHIEEFCGSGSGTLEKHDGKWRR